MPARKPKLLPLEKLLIKKLRKGLPVESQCWLDFARNVTWSEAGLALGLQPIITQELRLSVWILRDKKGEFKDEQNYDKFDWKGKDLMQGIAEFEAWSSQRRRLSVSVVKSLPAAPLLALSAASSNAVQTGGQTSPASPAPAGAMERKAAAASAPAASRTPS